ncbi:hypothetical protein [Turneriella parva]|uniref:Uncharacterized protein n=1 Tax=Turneriella parva (strain ATCC BAA-1111 / DSM 21527 / NCTC 11395 / H) TaxID=869212 RepID=I4B1R3_TURPD|nr:hypothetical protein [Turneriella parva]AFM11220.1 hypothetical protein Turpa_0568 [Turneriella parva DSM 21527]
MINSLENNILKPNSTTDEKFSFLLTIATNQQAYQFQNIYYGSAFWWYLLRDETIKGYADAYFGMDAKNAFGGIFLLLNFFDDNGYVSAKSLFDRCRAESRSTFSHLLDRFAISLEQFKKLKESDPKYRTVNRESASYSILRDFPILKIRDGYFMPISGLLIRKVTDEIYYDLLRFNRAKDENTANKFTKHFGIALQRLIDHVAQMTLNPKKTKVLSEFTKLKKGSPIHSADLHFLEQDWLTLIQIKNRRAPLSVHWGDVGDYKRIIDESIIQEYEQNLKVIRDRDIFYSEIPGINSTFKFISVVIHTEGFIHLNEEPIRAFIRQKITERECKFDKTPELNVCMDLLGYCNLLDFSLNANKHIFKILQDYRSYQENPEKTHRRLGNVLSLDFANWIAIKSSSSGKKHPFYKKYSAEFLEFAITFAGDNLLLAEGVAAQIRREAAMVN